jgi:hypothetical protein
MEPDVATALSLLAECLSDFDEDGAWDGLALVQRMEEVYEVLGGDLRALAP